MASYLIAGSTGYDLICIGLDIFKLTLLINPNSLILNSLTTAHNLPVERTPYTKLHQLMSMKLGLTEQQCAPYRSNPRNNGSNLFQEKV